MLHTSACSAVLAVAAIQLGLAPGLTQLMMLCSSMSLILDLPDHRGVNPCSLLIMLIQTGGGAGAAHGLCARRVGGQHRAHRGAQHGPLDAAQPRADISVLSPSGSMLAQQATCFAIAVWGIVAACTEWQRATVNIVPEVESAPRLSNTRWPALQVDSDTMDLLKTLGMSNLPGVKQQQAQTGGYAGFGGPAGGYGERSCGVSCTFGSVLPCDGLPFRSRQSLTHLLLHLWRMSEAWYRSIMDGLPRSVHSCGVHLTQLCIPYNDRSLLWRRPWRRRWWRRRLRWPVDGHRVLNTTMFVWWRCTMCQYPAERFDVSSHYVAWLPADAVLRRLQARSAAMASNDWQAMTALPANSALAPRVHDPTQSRPAGQLTYIPRFKCVLGASCNRRQYCSLARSDHLRLQPQFAAAHSGLQRLSFAT